MIKIKSNEFSEIDYRRLAKLHIDSIPDTSISIIGERAAALMYRFIHESKKELLLAATIDGTIYGGIVVSYEPATISRRFIKTYPIRFAARFFPSFIQNISRLPELFKLFAADDPYKYSPELMFLYTDQKLRSKGIGRFLVKEIALQIKEISPLLYVRTLDNKENRAIPFYERNGFKIYEAIEHLGKIQIVMVSEL